MVTQEGDSPKKPGQRRYGRGTFDAHPEYVTYMTETVNHANYAGMPNAVTDGHVNWQVSSGKTTSFNKFYVQRAEWWEKKADELKLSGTGNQQERFSIAARLIHPTGLRPCRLCGQRRNVGYFYLNRILAKRLNRGQPDSPFTWAQPIDVAIGIASEHGLEAKLRSYFPEREGFFQEKGFTGKAFEASSYLPSTLLSPGFMANPPDRLDGFHDYCLTCRGKNDPGRSDDNMRSYQHDRRAFQWWAEGEWALADALYAKAQAGKCSICGRAVDRVSPDHVGPLACGFKQLPNFIPACRPCNSRKNRRMRLDDVKWLLAYEKRADDSSASWQVRGLWDTNKARVASDAGAIELSAHMRALQDCYLRCLHALLAAGQARFLASLLHPDFAYREYAFKDLDPSRLTFASYSVTKVDSLGKHSLARRVVRIAFEELATYVEKELRSRKLRGGYLDVCQALTARALDFARKLPRTELDDEWDAVFKGRFTANERELLIGELLGRSDSATSKNDETFRPYLEELFYEAGSSIDLDLV